MKKLIFPKKKKKKENYIKDIIQVIQETDTNSLHLSFLKNKNGKKKVSTFECRPAIQAPHNGSVCVKG